MTNAERIAEWMSENGVEIGQCARSLGIPYESAKMAWKRLKRRLGRQAA